MPRICSDTHGLYLRHGGQVYRPQPNHTYARDLRHAHPSMRRYMFAGATAFYTGLLVRVYGARHLSIVVEPHPNLSSVNPETWSDHGKWTGQSQDSWMANAYDLDDQTFSEKSEAQLKEAMEFCGELFKRLGF